MKNIRLIIVAIGVTMFYTSCASLGEFIDYGINEWERIAPADSYDRTYIDAWQSGTGGKTLAASGLAASLLSKPSNEASQTAKRIINDAINDLNSHDEYKSNDVANWFGAMLTMGDAMISQYRLNQQIEEELEVDAEESETSKEDYTDYIDNAKREMDEDLTKSFAERNISMTIEKYYSLPKKERQEIDILLLQEPIKKEHQVATIQQIENKEPKLKTSYRDKIDSLSVGGYKFNNIILTDIQKDELNDIFEYLTADNTISIEIVGHTCSIGTENGNYNVGLQRAINAKNYLVERGIDADRIKVISVGYNCPKTSNDTPEGRAQNRRITFNVIKK